MREFFQGQLSAIEEQVDVGLHLAIATLGDVARSVVDTAAPTPSAIERTARHLHDAQRELSELVVTTMARQAPVAGDLRLVLVLLESGHHTGLIANQLDLINGQLMEIDPHTPDRLGTGRKLARMAQLAGSQLADAATALRQRDAGLARRVGAEDQALNQLNREVFTATLNCGAGEQAREVAMRHVLIARSLERIGDNAVDIAEQAVSLLTGHPCEFTDASRQKTRRAA
jgi:phosphate transport system protein